MNWKIVLCIEKNKFDMFRCLDYKYNMPLEKGKHIFQNTTNTKYQNMFFFLSYRYILNKEGITVWKMPPQEKQKTIHFIYMWIYFYFSLETEGPFSKGFWSPFLFWLEPMKTKNMTNKIQDFKKKKIKVFQKKQKIQIWSSLIKSDQTWSNLIKSDQNLLFDQIWSDLIRFDQIVVFSFFLIFLFQCNWTDFSLISCFF